MPPNLVQNGVCIEKPHCSNINECKEIRPCEGDQCINICALPAGTENPGNEANIEPTKYSDVICTDASPCTSNGWFCNDGYWHPILKTCVADCNIEGMLTIDLLNQYNKYS